MRKPIKWGTVVALGLALIVGFYLRSESWMQTSVVRPLQSDAAEYYHYAHNIRYHKTHSRQAGASMAPENKPTPDAFRSPGYPLLLATLIEDPPNGKMIKRIQLFQMLASTLTLVLAFYFFRCYLTPLLGGLAALLVAISPHLIMFNSYVLSETLFCFVIVLLGWVCCKFIAHPTPGFSVILGLIMGIGSLIRPSLQFFPLVMAVLVLVHFRPNRGIKFSLYILLGFILALSPWLIRNVMTLGKLSDNALMINFLHHGLYPDFKYKQTAESYRRPYLFDPRSEEIGANVKSVLAEIKSRFRTDPGNHLNWFLIKKPLSFWSWHMVQGHGDYYIYQISESPYSEKIIFQVTARLMQFLHWPLVILSLVGCLIVWRVPKAHDSNRPKIFLTRFTASLLLYYTVLHMAGAPFPRYSVPLRPFQYGMALFCLQYCYIAVASRKTRTLRCQ